MTLKQLAELVKQMRASQAAYFKFRRPSDLDASKQLERDVDRAVADILDDQRKLFD